MAALGQLWYCGLAIVLAVQCGKAGARAGYGLDAALNMASTDPLGEVDSFATLSPSLKSSLLNPGGFDTSRKMHSLLSLESTTLVNVKLVGFPGDDDGLQRSSLESQFARYMDALNQGLHVSVIGNDPHDLAIKTKVTVEVSRVGKQLSDKIFTAIKKHLDSVGSNSPDYRPHFYSVQSVPYNIVDEIIQASLEKPVSSYTVYLLNLRPQKRSYAYDFSPTFTPSYFPKCLGSFWTGKDRYMWIDLAAGPVEYGPMTSGEGLSKGEMFPMSSSYTGSQLQNSFMADLASLVWSAARMLFVPSVRVPVSYEEETEVHIIHIQGSNTTLTEDLTGLEIKNIEDAFSKEYSEGLLLPKQSLKFKYFSIKVAQCPICAAAIARAYKTYSARVFLPRYSLFVDEYLDSKQLHGLLSEFGPELEDLIGTNAPGSARVVPVYVLDIDSDRQVTLDRYHQVIPFRDMVIAVRSKTAQALTEYNCNGRAVLVQSRMLERPIVGALLQTLWGVTPTHLTWSAQHNDTLVDYRWGVGQTPFGPFSDLISLSFSQKDAAPRNLLYVMLNASISSALEVLDSIKGHGGEKKIFPKNHGEFLQRWNLYMYKLTKAVSSVSHFDFKTALYFVKSAENDLFSLHSLTYSACGELEASMVCFKDPPFPWFWAVLAFIVCVAAVYLWIRRDQLFVNKKKRF